MKKLLKYLLLVNALFSKPVCAQIQARMQRELQGNDFAAFKNFADHIDSKFANANGHWELLRDITPEHQEGLFIVDYSVPDKAIPNLSSVYTYGVKIISTKTRIIFYELFERNNKKVGDEWEPYDEVVDSFTDAGKFPAVNIAFRSVFKVDLLAHDLFNYDLTYGDHCGYAGEDPKGRTIINAMVYMKDKKGLMRWLQCANAERQVYAIDGLYQLEKKGDIKLTDEELAMINYVKSKKGGIHVCGGCMHYVDAISIVVHALSVRY